MSEASKKTLALVTAILMIATSVISVAAYLFINLGPLNNIFKPAAATDPNVDKDTYVIQVPNNGYAVYVRAAIVVNWQYKDGEGNVKVLGDVPVLGTDYTLTTNSIEWFKGSDGFYYRKAMVTPTGNVEFVNTEALVTSFAKKKEFVEYDDNGDGTSDKYYLNIDVISQTIQALGTTDDGDIPAVVDAWHVTMTGDLITGPVATD